MRIFDAIARFLTQPLVEIREVQRPAFCPRCSSRLFYLKVRAVWRCDKGHEFSPTDHSVVRFQVPE